MIEGFYPAKVLVFTMEKLKSPTFLPLAAAHGARVRLDHPRERILSGHGGM